MSLRDPSVCRVCGEPVPDIDQCRAQELCSEHWLKSLTNITVTPKGRRVVELIREGASQEDAMAQAELEFG
jgi:hypothetical protein